MTTYADSHVEFIHHPADLQTLADPDFALRQINPEFIEAANPELLFLAAYVEPDEGAWEKLIWVIQEYRRVIMRQGWQLARTSADLATPGLKIILHVEDVSAIGNDIAKLSELFDLGVRSIGLTHNRENQFAGGSLAAGVGVTALGYQVIDWLFKQRVILDFAHLSEVAFFEVVQHYQVAPFLSHSGLFSVHPNPRNVSDEILDTIAAYDGYIGIGFAGSFLADEAATIDHVLGQITYASERVGRERVGVGSDFGGIVSYLPRGLEDIRRVRELEPQLPDPRMLGDNLFGFLRRVWR